MLKVENLSTSYKTIDGNIKVINNLSFDIYENEIFGIAGESGCGKTTLLKALYDIIEFPLEVDSGRVILSGSKNGKPFSYETGQIRKTWWNNISYIPQAAQSVLNPIMRLKYQFLDSIPKEDRGNETEEETLERVAEYLKELSLDPDLLNAFPFQLSGGMRQRVIIALATFMSPNVVLADEPTTALDVVVQCGILMMLMRLQKQAKNTLVLVSHDMGVHYQITNRMGIMYSGSFVELGKTEDIFNNPIHPYTKMLIGALPRVGDKSPKVGIPGRPPALTNPPPGCRFAPRCPHAKDECHQAVPLFREVLPGRYAACHMLDSGSTEERQDHSKAKNTSDSQLADAHEQERSFTQEERNGD
jgi:peptide/nickel transport system ATP-binding protein